MEEEDEEQRRGSSGCCPRVVDEGTNASVSSCFSHISIMVVRMVKFM